MLLSIVLTGLSILPLELNDNLALQQGIDPESDRRFPAGTTIGSKNR
jgi:hypothetical protein